MSFYSKKYFLIPLLLLAFLPFVAESGLLPPSLEQTIRSRLVSDNNAGADKDFLFIFINRNNSMSDFNKRLDEILSPGNGAGKLLKEHFQICKIELDPKAIPNAGDADQALAEKMGIMGTPSLYLADHNWRPYAHYIGGIRPGINNHQWAELIISLKEKKNIRNALMEEVEKKEGKEKSDAILKLLNTLPSETVPGCYSDEVEKILISGNAESLTMPPSYLHGLQVDNDEEKERLIARNWPNPRLAAKENVGGMLDTVDEYLLRDDISSELQSFILFQYRLPLLFAKARYEAEDKGKGVFSAESDRLMRRALDDLNTIIKLTPHSFYGREAQRLKTEINTERRKLP